MQTLTSSYPVLIHGHWSAYKLFPNVNQHLNISLIFKLFFHIWMFPWIKWGLFFPSFPSHLGQTKKVCFWLSNQPHVSIADSQFFSIQISDLTILAFFLKKNTATMKRIINKFNFIYMYKSENFEVTCISYLFNVSFHLTKYLHCQWPK